MEGFWMVLNGVALALGYIVILILFGAQIWFWGCMVEAFARYVRKAVRS